MELPNLDRAQIDSTKLAGYVLNANHPEGRHKARVFRSALGITGAHAGWLADAIRAAAGKAEAVLQAETDWGTIYRVDVEIRRGEHCAKVRTAWLSKLEKTRLVTCFVIGECNETS